MANDNEQEEVESRITSEIKKTKQIISDIKKEITKVRNLNPDLNPNRDQRIAELEETQKQNQEHLEELKSELKTLQDDEEAGISASLKQVEEQWLNQNPTAAYIIDEQQFVFIKDYSSIPEKQNVQLRRLEPARFAEFLANELKLKSWNLPQIRIKDLFNRTGRTFEYSRYSVKPEIWQKKAVYHPIQHLEKYFINNYDLKEDEIKEARQSLPFFDILMYSLSGGKEENQEHIERWILHKIINYHKAVTTPDLVIVGHVGGNGKGILQAIIRQMLPAMLSGLANTKTLNGSFNAILAGKIIVFFDDQNSKEIPLDVVKQLAGSETMIFERKGFDQYEAEKTCSSAWFANKLPFRLTPAGQEGGVDRRFSVMATNITFLESIRRYAEQELNQILTVEQSKDLAETIVGRYLLNRINIAYWFKCLQQKYPEIDSEYTLKPLHGSDYHYFLNTQRTTYEVIWQDLVVPVLAEGGIVPIFVIKELIRHLDGRVVGDKTIHKQLTTLATENKIEIEHERMYVEIEPSVGNNRKQCVVIRNKDNKLSANKKFNWNLVSNQKYCVPATGRDLIEEDNFIFGVRNIVDDDEVEIDDEYGEKPASLWDDR